MIFIAVKKIAQVNKTNPWFSTWRPVTTSYYQIWSRYLVYVLWAWLPKPGSSACTRGHTASGTVAGLHPGTVSQINNRTISFFLHYFYVHQNKAVILRKVYTANEGPVRIQYKCLVPIHIFPEMKLLFPKQNYNILSPSSYTPISVRDLYISRIGLPILLQENIWADPVNI